MTTLRDLIKDCCVEVSNNTISIAEGNGGLEHQDTYDFILDEMIEKRLDELMERIKERIVG